MCVYIYKLCFVVLNFLARHQVQSHVAQSAHSMLGNSGRQAGNKRETSVESGGPENPKHTARQSETSAGQVGDKCRTSSSEHPQHTGRQVGGNCRIMGPKELVVRVIPAQGTYRALETSGR